MITLAAQVIFYGLMIVLAVFSLTMIYVLIRFGKSKILGLVLIVFYIVLMMSLYTAAQLNFNTLPFL